MRALITGINGFIGSHLADFLVAKGWEVSGTSLTQDLSNVAHLLGKITVRRCDMRRREEVKATLEESKPQVIFHLAAQSRPDISWKDPWTTMEVNVLGAVNLFEAVRELNLDPKILVACSSAEYGPTDEPLREDHPLRPLSPYAVSKVAQDLMAHQYFQNYGLKTYRVRIFGTTGPRKTGDALADFASQIARAEIRGGGVVTVGNLEARRDLTDVRDMVRALLLVLEKGRVGDVYNACTGEAHRMGDLLERLIRMSRARVEIKVDPKKLRPSDEPLIVGNNEKIRRECGWEPEIKIDKTLSDILEWWRERYARKNSASYCDI